MTKEIFPKATIFKVAQMTGVEDRILNTYASLVKKLPLIPMVNGGETRLQLTYVRDAADAIIGSLNTKDSIGKTYYLAGPEIMTYASAPRNVSVFRILFFEIHTSLQSHKNS